MSDPGKYAKSRRSALQMKKELDSLRDRAVLERYASQLVSDSVPSSKPPPAPACPSASRRVRPLTGYPNTKKMKSPSKKSGHVPRPQLKMLGISSLHNTSGPAAHTQRPHHLPPLASWQQGRGNKKRHKKPDIRLRSPLLPAGESGGCRGSVCCDGGEVGELGESVREDRSEMSAGGDVYPLQPDEGGSGCDEMSLSQCPSSPSHYSSSLPPSSPSPSQQAPSSLPPSSPSPSPPPSQHAPSSLPSSSPSPSQQALSSLPPSSPSPSPSPSQQALSSLPPFSPSPSPSPSQRSLSSLHPSSPSPSPSPSQQAPSSLPPSPSPSPSQRSLSSLHPSSPSPSPSPSQQVLSPSSPSQQLLTREDDGSTLSLTDGHSHSSAVATTCPVGRDDQDSSSSSTLSDHDTVTPDSPDHATPRPDSPDHATPRPDSGGECVSSVNGHSTSDDEECVTEDHRETDPLQPLSSLERGGVEAADMISPSACSHHSSSDQQQSAASDSQSAASDSQSAMGRASDSQSAASDSQSAMGRASGSQSAGPVTLQDVLSLHGTCVTMHTPLTHIPAPPSTGGQVRSGVTYLATTSQQSSQHKTIHHFCTEMLLPELPAAVQAQQLKNISRRPHPSLHAEIPSKITRSEDQDTSDYWKVAGKRMEVAQNPSNLLWTPVPPKLSLYPHTVTTHLLPHLTNHTPVADRELVPTSHVRQLNDIIIRASDHPPPSPPPSHPPSPPPSHPPSHPPSPPPSPPPSHPPSPPPSHPPSPPPSHPPSHPPSPPPSHPPSPPPSHPPSPPPDTRTISPLSSSPSPSTTPSISSPPHPPHSPHPPDSPHPPHPPHSPLPPDSPHKHPPQISSLGAMAMREYEVILEQVSRQRQHIQREVARRRRETAAATPSSGGKTLHCQSSRHQLKRQLSRLAVDRPPGSRWSSRQEPEPVTLETTTSATAWKLRRRAIQCRGGRKRRSVVRTSSGILRTKLAREALETSSGRRRVRRASHPTSSHHQEREEREERDYRRSRRHSLPRSPNFTALMRAHRAPMNSDPWEWAQGVWWGVWFPEVLRECRRALGQYYHGDQLHALIGSSIPEGGVEGDETVAGRREREQRERSELSEFSEGQGEVIELQTTVPCEGDSSVWEEECECVEEELGECEGDVKMAELLSRRAMLHWKMGRLSESASDVAHSSALSPYLPSTLWTRHILCLITGRHQAAMDDLLSITNSPPPPPHCLQSLDSEVGHFFLALLALAHHRKSTGSTSTALTLISKAIELCPGSVECLLERAALYEASHHHIMAVRDYTTVLSLQPWNSLALERLGDHYLKEKQWREAKRHYSNLLLVEPHLTRVRVQRAQALTHMGQHTAAVSDLSTAVHTDPSDHRARFWRGSLLRRVAPHQSLLDLSVALLLAGAASTHETANIFLYRALVYATLKCYPESLSDLSSALALHPSLLTCHIITSLLHYSHMHNPLRATRCLTAALRVDPTSQTALLIRAEALKSQGKLQEAIRDYCRLIHIRPDLTTAYILRGNIFRQLRDTAQAREHARIIQKLTINDEPTAVKALVAAFLHNDTEAVVISAGLPPSLPHSILRGKLLTKAGRYPEAIQALTSLADHMTKTDQSECRVVLGIAHLYAGDIGEVVRVLGGEEGEGVPRILQEVVYTTRGVAYLCLGQHRAGLADINRALITNPQSYKAYLIRAAQFAREGRLAKAILNCNEAVALQPNSSRAFIYRGILKYLSGNCQSAVDDLTHSVQLAPSNVHLPLFNRAIAYHAIGEIDKAFADYSRAAAGLSLSPPSPSFLALPLLVNRGLLSILRGDIATALHDLTAAQLLTPNDPALSQAIALCHHCHGDLPAALSSYSSALALDAVFLEALVGRGDVFMDLASTEDRERARQDYCRALEIQSSYEPARIRLAYLLQTEGSFMKAWSTLTEAGEKLSPPLLAARGVVCLQMGQPDGAMQDLSRSIWDAPSAETLTNRGVVHCFLGDMPSAMHDYQRALTFDPTYSLAHFNIGNLLLSQHQFREAVRSYDRALGGCHDDAVLVNRGLGHVMLGETERAMADLTAAITLNPHAGHAFFNRGNISCSLGALESAKQDYITALQLVPDDWLCQYSLGQVCGELGDRERAVQLFQQAALTEIT